MRHPHPPSASPPRPILRRALPWLMALALAAAGAWPLRPAQAQAAAGQAIHFTLNGPAGPVTERSHPGKHLLLAIGYTTCPDICPTTLYEWAQTLQTMRRPEAIAPLFVSIDPGDTPQALQTYTRFFDERIVGLTGEPERIQALARQLGATFGYRLNGQKVAQPQPGSGYGVYHSALIYLIGPDRKLIDVFDYQIGAEGLTAALDKVLGDAPANTSGK